MIVAWTKVIADRVIHAVVHSRFAALPLNVHPTPERLRIDFRSAEEFLTTPGALIYRVNKTLIPPALNPAVEPVPDPTA